MQIDTSPQSENTQKINKTKIVKTTQSEIF